MPALPRTRTIRRQLATTIRSQLNDYTGGRGGLSQISDHTGDTPLQVAHDAAVLALLEGWSPDTLRLAVERAIRLYERPAPAPVKEA
jgi:hypothetical protein